ncbi:hypothetical protein A3C87_02370 [Candidatus Kaiserbacteria bacterium RIFCSPHIGHO2_02_FULL_49_34]|uniref:Thymidylate kinase-like domain-containing protein n=1 Tax=Candidatus Kaiserbacteria bacterium RIFCSPHIGHO2_02_FULL_49_34 TaxID=1798491 RepID=A0A1F6DMC5_9BACT|nr:MAG: hypothetical protein A3C87_02370 [Candidatus Kaiserbacteria bacterium RIFCSPHIGHO2_02_FULL_49_34]
MNTKRGKLIVIDGGDGAGKASQTRMLTEHLRADGHSVETLDFPQYTQSIFGKLLRECLDGKRGDFMSYDPRVTSLLYGLDRFVARDKINNWLDAGSIVILDRYTTANMLHQGAKIANEDEFAEYLTWLEEVEYRTLGIPKPDLVFLLNTPLSYRQKLLEQSAAENKHGTNTRVDLAERDTAHQLAAEKALHFLIARNKDWKEIRCATDTKLRSFEDIHQEIFTEVQSTINA